MHIFSRERTLGHSRNRSRPQRATCNFKRSTPPTCRVVDSSRRSSSRPSFQSSDLRPPVIWSNFDKSVGSQSGTAYISRSLSLSLYITKVQSWCLGFDSSTRVAFHILEEVCECFLVHLKQLSLASQKRRAQFGSFNTASRKKRLKDHVLCGQSRVDRRSGAVDAGLLKVGTNFVYVVQVLDNRW